MTEPGGGPRFTLKTGLHDPLARYDLDRHLPFEMVITRLPDRAERACAETLAEAIAPEHQRVEGSRSGGRVRLPAGGWQLAGAHSQLFHISDLVPADGHAAPLPDLHFRPLIRSYCEVPETPKEPQLVVLRRRG